MSNNEHISDTELKAWLINFLENWKQFVPAFHVSRLEDGSVDEAKLKDIVLTFRLAELKRLIDTKAATLVDKAYDDGCKFGSDTTMAAYKGGERQVETLIQAELESFAEEIKNELPDPDIVDSYDRAELLDILQEIKALANRKGK